MDGHSPSPCDESDNLISRNRIAAFGKPHCHVVHAFDNDSALLFLFRTPFPDMFCRLQNLFICDLLLLVFIELLRQLIDNLALFQSAVSHGCAHRLPVFKPIFELYLFNIFRL